MATAELSPGSTSPVRVLVSARFWRPIGLAVLLSLMPGCSEPYPEPGRVYEDVETYSEEFRCIDGSSPISAVEVGGVIFFYGGDLGDYVLPEGSSGTFRVTGHSESVYEGPNLVGELTTPDFVATFYSEVPVAC